MRRNAPTGWPEELLTGVPWSLPALRRWWNQNKREIAPWWAENSKEAYNSGLDALARGLKQWSQGRSGKRRGPKAGFPRFKSRRRSRVSCRFTTGAIRVGDGSHVVLPRIGRVKTHERTTALFAGIGAGTARIMAATVSWDGRRWYCSFTAETGRVPGRPAHAGPDRAHPVVGVDARGAGPAGGGGPGRRPRWPGCPRRAPWPKRRPGYGTCSAAGPARTARTGAPGGGGSKRWRRTAGRIGRIHARAADLRRDALHQATTALARRHQVIVIEDLAVQNMTRRKPGAGKGGRGLNRALADAGLGELRRQLGYKTTWYGSCLIVADRWYPSSKTCSACGGRKPSLTLAERTWTCHGCGAVHDRDVNAATNLARLSEHAARVEPRPAGSGPVAGRGAIQKTPPGGAGGEETSTRRTSPRWTRPGPPLRKERLPDP